MPPHNTTFLELKELGIALTAYGVLSRGLLSGARPLGAGHFRAALPHFQGENLKQNLRLDAVAGTRYDQHQMAMLDSERK